jgi:hypothetical protein
MSVHWGEAVVPPDTVRGQSLTLSRLPNQMRWQAQPAARQHASRYPSELVGKRIRQNEAKRIESALPKPYSLPFLSRSDLFCATGCNDNITIRPLFAMT